MSDDVRQMTGRRFMDVERREEVFQPDPRWETAPFEMAYIFHQDALVSIQPTQPTTPMATQTQIVDTTYVPGRDWTRAYPDPNHTEGQPQELRGPAGVGVGNPRTGIDWAKADEEAAKVYGQKPKRSVFDNVPF